MIKRHRFKNKLIAVANGTDIEDVEVGFKKATSEINLFYRQQSKFLENQHFSEDKADVGGKKITTLLNPPSSDALSDALLPVLAPTKNRLIRIFHSVSS